MNDRATLHAGGLVPANSKLGKDDVVDTVVARAYAHPVLPGRTVIRLCAEGVAAGDELEMATLGFGPATDLGVVGKERKRPLGFPGWALVHDPEHARYALDVVKELKQHARKAKSKPGHAKEAFDAIAARLAKTVPHFLPSFYEEVGRVFIEHGAISYASQMFGKARQVEAVHALEVDEQHRVDGFLEFALAGAVTTKALSEYGKALSDSHEPKQAYAHFRQLCVQRTLGGMPPWSGMAKDLARLARAAKLDVAEQDAALIAEIIESPALAKAAGEFWRAYAAPIEALAKQSARVRGVLLDLFPTGSSASRELDDAWLDLLEATGALDALIAEVPPEARPANGRAAWFDKLCAHVSRDWRSRELPPRVFALLRRMAPALIADGAPIAASSRHRVDLDLAELALELGIPVVPPANRTADAGDWAKTAGQPEHGRDPVRCAAHPTLGPLLRAAVVDQLGNAAFDQASHGKPGFLEAKRQWLAELLAGAEGGALPALDALLDTVEKKASAGTFAELPELHARFAALEVAPLLARTLQVGLIDELGWPALEDAVAELDPDQQGLVALHGGLPVVIAATKTRAIAIAGGERVGVHDFVVPPKHELVTVRFIGEQFLVVLKEGYKVWAYWSAAPHERWLAEGTNVWSIPAFAHRAVVRPDGAWLEGTFPLRAGDRRLPFAHKILAADHATAWVSDYHQGEVRWRELSPTGELGRHSWPAWIEAYAEEGWKLDTASHYLAAPSWLTASPLGVAGGFVGARLRWRGGPRVQQPYERQLESIDGATFTGHTQLHELLALPETGARRPIRLEYTYGKSAALSIYEPGGAYAGSTVGGGDARYARGQAIELPSVLLHALSPRDAAGSARLHAATLDDARALLAVAPALHADQPPPAELPGLLPEVTHPRLRRGLAGVVTLAARLALRRDQLATERAPGRAQARTEAGPDDATLLAALPGWLPRQYGAGGSAWAQLALTGAAFADPDRTERTIRSLGASPVDWFDAAVLRAALPVLAVAVGTPAALRPVVARLYEHLERALPPADKLRVLRVHGQLPGETHQYTAFQLRWVSGNAYAIRQWGYAGKNYQILEYAPSGTFALPWPVTIDREARGVLGGPPVEEVHAAVAAGRTSWSEEAAARLAADTGLLPSEAAFLWAGCPNQEDRKAGFLDNELRELLGLKAAQAALARDALNIPKFGGKLAALAELGRGGLAAVLDGTGAATLATAWKRLYGARVALPEALVAEADAQGLSRSPATALARLLEADASPALTVDGSYAFDEHGTLIRASKAEPLVGQSKLADGPPHFEPSDLPMLSLYLPFLYAELPVGDPVRALAVRVHELALARLASPTLWLTVAAAWLDQPKCEELDKQLDAAGGELLPGMSEGRTFRRLPGGAVVRWGTNITVHVQPAELEVKARVWLTPLIAQLGSYGTHGHDIDYLRGDALRGMMARITATPVPAGGWEQNPLLSVPALVERVQRQRELSREAAALYLMYLVLLWPTPKAIARYTGWKPAAIAAAQAELVERELVLEAKRERAQRGHFLPGGWEALKSPHPPMESWKLPFYGTRTPAGTMVVPTSGRFLAREAFHVLFERAWRRIEDGDEPRYEEVKR